ncbi:MAG: hypothetical protein ACYTFO_05740, partial [Planctomycetota bacterium]
MAVDHKQSSPGAATDETLQRGGAIWAAATSVLSAAAWIVILAVHMATREAAPDIEVLIYQGVWMGVFALFGILGLAELTRRLWAHQALLILAGALLVASLMHALGAAIWGQASWWMTGMPLVAIIPVAAAAPLCLWMLAAATAPKTRLRYGSVVIASAAVAIGVAGAVNLIAQKDYVRRTTQALGRFGPSERTKQLVRALDQPVRLTCAYTSKNPDRLGSDYGPQLLELLEDIAEYGRRHGKEITVVNAANEFDRAGVILALKERLNAQAADHVAFLQAAAEASPQLAADAERAAGQWQALPPNSYLAQWDLPEVMSRYLGESAQQLSIQAADLESELESVALLDYEALVDQTRQALSSTRNGLTALATAMRQIDTIPEAVAERRGPVDQALRQCVRSAAEMIDVIGQINDPVPDNPEGVLLRYAARLKEAAGLAQTMSQMLPNVAGEENARLIGQNLSWYVELRVGESQSRYETPQALLANQAEVMAERAYIIEGTTELARPEYLADLLQESRGQALLIAAGMRQVVEIIRERLDRLEQMDEDTEQFLAYALEEGPVRSLLDSLDGLLDQADGLPPVEASRLAEDTQQENILIVEVGDEAEIIPFESVWPEKFQMLSQS